MSSPEAEGGKPSKLHLHQQTSHCMLESYSHCRNLEAAGFNKTQIDDLEDEAPWSEACA